MPTCACLRECAGLATVVQPGPCTQADLLSSWPASCDAPAMLTSPRSFVTVDNEREESSTVLEVEIKDYPGLLRIIAWVLNGLDLVAENAVVSTDAEGIAHNTFWLTSLSGERAQGGCGDSHMGRRGSEPGSCARGCIGAAAGGQLSGGVARKIAGDHGHNPISPAFCPLMQAIN